MTGVVVVDLDGTLYPGNTFHAWIRHLAAYAARHGRFLLLSRLMLVSLRRATGLTDHRGLKRTVLELSATVPLHERSAFARSLARGVRPVLMDRIRAARADGLTVALSTAAPDLYLGPLCAALGIDEYDGTPAVVDVDAPWAENLGVAKLRALEERHGPDVLIDTLYTDHPDDLPLARRAARTVLVAATPRSREAFRTQGITVEPLEPRPPRPARHPVGALMVTYNSDAVVGNAVRALEEGSLRPDVLVIVDNGSDDPGPLHRLARDRPWVRVVEAGSNLGFCAGNNLGLPEVGHRHLLLLNPDAFVSEDFLAAAVRRLDADPGVGAVGPKLLSADATTGAPTGLLDSVGIGQTSYGRLFDRGQGERDFGQHDRVDEPTALCAAAMLVRAEAVTSVAPDGALFDESFFMYKEDIDLSWRLRRAGWRLVVDPSLTTLHCRGWQQHRRSMPGWARRRSMQNEWRLWLRGWAPGRWSRWSALPYLAAKSVVVAIGR